MLSAHWKVSLPADESMIGPMVTLPLPPMAAEAVQPLRDALLFDDRIEVQMHVFKGQGWVRLCGAPYIDASDVDRFRDAVDRRIRR